MQLYRLRVQSVFMPGVCVDKGLWGWPHNDPTTLSAPARVIFNPPPWGSPLAHYVYDIQLKMPFPDFTPISPLTMLTSSCTGPRRRRSPHTHPTLLSRYFLTNSNSDRCRKIRLLSFLFLQIQSQSPLFQVSVMTQEVRDVKRYTQTLSLSLSLSLCRTLVLCIGCLTVYTR